MHLKKKKKLFFKKEQVFITDYSWVACKRDLLSSFSQELSFWGDPIQFFCMVMDGFLLLGTECLHLIYSSHCPLVTAVGGLSNLEN